MPGEMQAYRKGFTSQAPRYANGIFRYTSFHQERGDNRYPIVAIMPPEILCLCFISLQDYQEYQ
jgi:hypothetical protein